MLHPWDTSKNFPAHWAKKKGLKTKEDCNVTQVYLSALGNFRFSLFFFFFPWMGSARNNYWIWYKENSRSPKLPYDFSSFRALKLLLGNRPSWHLGTVTSGDKLFLVFLGFHFDWTYHNKKLIKPPCENHKIEQGIFYT